MSSESSPLPMFGEGQRGGVNPAPITGQGDEFFQKLTEWEMEELRKLPASYFGDTQPCGDTTGDMPLLASDFDTEPYNFDTKRITPIRITDCGEDW